MATLARCPYCGKIQRPVLRREIVELRSRDAASRSRLSSLRAPLVLVLSLTIVGLPLAHRLAKQFERQDRKDGTVVSTHAYRCSRCGRAWACGESIAPSLDICQDGAAEGQVPTSFLGRLTHWWLDP